MKIEGNVSVNLKKENKRKRKLNKFNYVTATVVHCTERCFVLKTSIQASRAFTDTNSKLLVLIWLLYLGG